MHLLKIKNEKVQNTVNFIILLLKGNRGTIENHQFKTVKPKMKSIIINKAKVNLNLEKGSFLCSLFLDLQRVTNNKIPHIPVAITHSVE